MSENQNELNKKQKKIALIISLTLVLALVIGISYAYFAAQGQSNEQRISTSDMKLEFDDGTAIVNATGLNPITRDEVLTKAAKKTFTVTNTGTEKIYIHLSLDDMVLPERLKRFDFMWSLYEGNTNIGNGTFDVSNNNIKIGEYQVFEPSESKTYSLYMWIEETNLNQSIMMGQTFKTSIKAEGEIYWTSPESDFVVQNGVLTKYIGDDETVIIPSVVNGVTVTEIDSEICMDDEGRIKNITKVVIPNTVTQINHGAFYDTKLSTVVIPNSVTEIGGASFMMTKLENISLPNSVVNIDSEAFSDTNLTSIMIPDSVTSIGESAFMNTNLKGIIIPNKANANGAIASGSESLKTIVFANGTTSVDMSIIDGLSLDDFSIPNTVTEIGGTASDASLKKLIIPDSVTSIESFDMLSLESVTLGKGISELPMYVFGGNNLTSIVIPKNINSIDVGAFDDNPLTQIIFEGRSDLSDMYITEEEWYNGTAQIIFKP